MEPTVFAPKTLNKQSLSEEIVFQIKEMIADGRLKPNQRLPTEQELCKAFSVGRTTVREALMALSALGLIKKDRHNVYVADSVEHPLREFYLHLMIDHYDSSQLYETRLIIEGSVARLACLRATDEQIQKMKQFTQQMESEDIETYITADLNYHNLIVLAADNRVIYEMYQVVRFLLEKTQREIVKNPETRKISRQQHKEILQAIENRDPEKARQLMTIHIQSMIKMREICVGPTQKGRVDV